MVSAPWRQSSASESLPQSRWAGQAVGAKLISPAAVNYYPTLEELPLQYSWAFLVAQLVKSICLQRGRPGFDPLVGKIPWRRERLPTPVFWPGEFYGLYWTRLSHVHFH